MKRQLKSLQRELDHAENYETWRELALEFDKATGLDEWKVRQNSDFYDHHLVRSRLNKLKELRKTKQDDELLYMLNEGIHGNLGGIGRSVLYTHAKFGTKKLIIEYIDEVVAALIHISQIDDKQLPLDRKLEFFHRASHCFGRSALMLSGGANYGMFHLGVAKALFEQKVLPTVISGSSAGSIIAAVVGTHSDEDLQEYFNLEQLNAEAMKFMGWKRLVKGKNLLDGDHLEETLSRFIPDLTFREAYEKTGRQISVTISPARLNHESRMLNAISSPNVFVRRGVLASTAVPGLFPAVTLTAKNSLGEAQPYNPARQWVDGSLSNDLPGKRLSRLYGVNHFIASQVNPHVTPFINDKHKATLMQMVAQSGTNATKNIVTNLLKYTKDNFSAPSVSYMLSQVHALLAQDYSADITITPDFSTLNPWRLFNNPSTEDIQKLVLAGERSTWPKIEWIRNCTKVSRALDGIIEQLENQEKTTKKKAAKAS